MVTRQTELSVLMDLQNERARLERNLQIASGAIQQRDRQIEGQAQRIAAYRATIQENENLWAFLEDKLPALMRRLQKQFAARPRIPKI